MPDPVTSDAVESRAATLERAGRTDRPKLTLPAEAADVPEGEPVEMVLDGAVRHATAEPALEGGLEIRGAYDNARLARERDGQNRLVEWVVDHDLGFGRTVHLDVIEPGVRYGLRAPGERAVYEPPGRPDPGLADIARDVADGSGAGR